MNRRTSSLPLEGAGSGTSATAPRGHGQMLLEAIEAFERFPAVTQARDRLLELTGAGASAADLVPVVESDSALTIGVLRLSGTSDVPAALAALSHPQLHDLASTIPTFELMGDAGEWSAVARHFRLHAQSTLQCLEHLIGVRGAKSPDELRVGALLHDIGKLVLLRAYGRYGRGRDGTPRDRLAAERRAWGLDHALVGGVMARRLGLPERIATLIERHHSDDADGDVPFLRLADGMAHYSAAHPVDSGELVAVAESAGIPGDALAGLLYELPSAMASRRCAQPSPLSRQQTAAIRLLREGARVKEIASSLDVSPSTVRTHLFNAYSKLGVKDRTQAVLLAADRGWI